ncbi:GxxExxY protein [Niabella aurantiaca]|uniref:GxxExxY protein n=1 Tax=Niabella aurantiaca TaxID=379900 RepID=UPI000372721E|nr:GxxExxY protein [Niabella aurantiaca]
MKKNFDEKEYPWQSESYVLIGIAMEIHRILGKGFLEIVYKDAFEYELNNRGIFYEREKEYSISYKNIILPHRFCADFVIENKIILELKSRKGIVEDHYAQVINYLAVSKLRLGLLINFHEKSLEYKRIISSES